MPLWLCILLLTVVIKLILASLMLWIPYRYDESRQEADVTDSSEEDGGSKALPGSPLDPHPRMPLPRGGRRGPHGAPALPSPPRVRTSTHRSRPLRVSH